MARRNKGEGEGKKGAPEWMNTYGDMVTLLLCFFVLLFAFSEVDSAKFEAVIQSFQGSLGVLESGQTIDDTDYVTDTTIDDMIEREEAELEDFRKLKEDLQEFLDDRSLNADVLLTLETRGLMLRFQDNILFDSGRAELRPGAKEILTEISEFLERPLYQEKSIRVEGHTDTVPTGRWSPYETNWELSTARATSVVRFFIEDVGVKPERFSATGFSKYHPIAPNDTDENKQKNRRVDVVIMRSEQFISVD
ncbi:OmpA family protein [Serpentinicella sp. ANB-PHB4]|uniref:flagellar motor protein MotB n=1 Tax=Serpentinicella sp. ANB-PHB4 TaxID=3074076 RepID=UPI002858B79E|nr:OmpA family protein [Serpentinicella sp. ANB-PHB4]MDR5658260.1 OmpA family protein [Serpentinicella sp. ANB-PHB4]